MGFSKSSAKGKVRSNTGIPQETRKSRVNNQALHLKQLEKEEIKNPRVSRRKEILKIRAETNDNKNTITQNLGDSVKSVLKGRFTAIQAYLKKQEKNQTNNLTLHLKQLEKEEIKNPRVSRRKEIKIRAEINAKETNRP